eukprot:COSAG06_NODE_6313_length_2988_cov_83.511942_1_plen_58_part_10
MISMVDRVFRAALPPAATRRNGARSPRELARRQGGVLEAWREAPARVVMLMSCRHDDE